MEFKEMIGKLLAKENLTENEAYEIMGLIFDGAFTNTQIGAFLTALKIKGETKAEIIGFTRQMRARSLRVNLPQEKLVDTCGTGGDAQNTFNISTVAAFIAAGAGVKIAKHGNRFASSSCGSADVLEYLGVNLKLTPEQMEEAIQTTGIGFLFAPNHHQAMKQVVLPRKELGFRTAFNILGPLTNPAGAEYQVLGVFDYNFAKLMAETLQTLGTKRALIVHGTDGLDEITTTGKTKICELNEQGISEYLLDPISLNLDLANLQELRGGSIAENADILTSILQGAKGKKREIAILNAAATIYVNGSAPNLPAGIKIAAEAIDNGHALNILHQYIAFSRRCA